MDKDELTQEQEAVVEETPTTEQEPMRGRGAFMKRYRDAHPDIEDDPDDDILFDYAGSAFSERDELKGRYDSLNGANEKLAQIIGEDPRFAQFIAMVANGEDLWYALGSTFGDIINNLDEESLGKLQEGQSDYKNRYKQMQDNFSNFEKRLSDYGKANGLSEENVNDIKNTILDLADMFNTGDISEEMFEMVYKGIDYDTDKTAEIEAAKLAGRNEAIVDQKNRKTSTPLPDMGGDRVAPRPPSRPVFEEEEPPSNYFDSLEKIK